MKYTQHTAHAHQKWHIVKRGTGNSSFRFSSLKATFKRIHLRVIWWGWARTLWGVGSLAATFFSVDSCVTRWPGWFSPLCLNLLMLSSTTCSEMSFNVALTLDVLQVLLCKLHWVILFRTELAPFFFFFARSYRKINRHSFVYTRHNSKMKTGT